MSMDFNRLYALKATTQEEFDHIKEGILSLAKGMDEMMNVARLDLCKELYELSGWAQSLYEHELLSGEHYTTTLPRKAMEHSSQNIYIPAYDLGYLLRKLQTTIDYLRPSTVSKQWVVKGPWSEDEDSLIYADTPEDAAALLAIELFKQGVLKR